MVRSNIIYNLSECGFRGLLQSDTKDGLVKKLKALGIKVSVRQKKGKLVDMINTIFTDNPFHIIDRLPKGEQDRLRLA